ncbi:extracellular solute-binding protein [Streptomyces sp. NPDC047108]|uniref:extracellular solute-binding protein n=1 Tax=Streptomyces sp. NPDC047108 TaxID=3155025 RepID=UPI0033D8002B
MRRALPLALVATCAVLAAGCVTSSPDDSAKAGKAEGTITFWHSYSADSPEVKTLREKVIPDFEAQHPRTKVKDVSIPYEQLHQKVITSAAGGTLPDVLRSDIVWVPEFAKLGLIEDMKALLPDFDKIAAKTYPGPLETNKYRDTYWGVPLDTNTRVMLYNSDALKKAGLKTPPKTFKDMRSYADKLSAKGVKLFADDNLTGWNVAPWIWSAGGEITDKDHKKATGYLNSPASVRGVQLLQDLYDKKQIPKLIVGSRGSKPLPQGLAKGDYATLMDGPWLYPVIKKQYPGFAMKAAPVPAGPGGSISVVGGENVVVTKSSENKKLAAEFTRYLLSPKAQKTMAEVGQMSVLKDVDMAAIDPVYKSYAEQLKTARPRTPVANWPKIDDLLKKKLQTTFTNHGDVKKALDEAAAEIDALLAEG